jgi:hypothetical protein
MKHFPADTLSMVAIQVLSNTIHVYADSPKFLNRFKKLCAYFNLRTGPQSGAACTFRVQTRTATGDHRLFMNDREILRTDNLAYLLACFEYEMYAEVIRREANHLLVHAGAVCLRESGVLLAGEKGAGKTTLVAFLIKNGFRYVSDEMSAIAFDSGRLTPVPRSLNIKEPVRERLSAAGGALKILPYGDDPANYRSHFALPRPDSVTRQPVPISLIVFPRYRSGSRTRVQALKKTEAAVELVRHSHNFSWLPEKCFDAIADLAGKAPSLRLGFGNPEEAVEEIRRQIPGA